MKSFSAITQTDSVEHLLTFALSFIHNKQQLQSCQQSRNQNTAIFIRLRNITQHKSAVMQDYL